jgi:hypothetical protein
VGDHGDLVGDHRDLVGDHGDFVGGIGGHGLAAKPLWRPQNAGGRFLVAITAPRNFLEAEAMSKAAATSGKL